MKTTPTLRAALALALALGLARAGSAQVEPPADLGALADQMAGRLHRLREDIAADLGANPQGQQLAQNTQELDQSVDQLRETIRVRPDVNQLRQSFAGIDNSWQYLRGQLTQPGATTPVVARDAQGVDEADARLRQALGLNNPPQAFYGNAPAAPTGGAETERLSHALVDRANGLLAAVQSSMPGQVGATVAAEARRLTVAADQFHDQLDPNQPPRAFAPAFLPVDECADRLERFIVNSPDAPPPVQTAWQGFAAVEVLIHQNLGLASAQPAVPVNLVAAAPAGGGPSPLLGLADQLVQQTTAFVEVFGPTARVVPEGLPMLADAQQLQAAAANFRQDAGGNLAPNQLAYEFRDVDAVWQRLARRVNRVARGRMGPNIGQVQKLGALCQQIHQALAMPGYPAALNGPAFDQP